MAVVVRIDQSQSNMRRIIDCGKYLSSYQTRDWDRDWIGI